MPPTRCPGCARLIDVPDTRRGEEFRCPACAALLPPPARETTTFGSVAPLVDDPASRPSPASSAPPGYEALAELGRGGTGVVYRARQVALNREVALKMILSGAHAGADERARFRTEAEAIARLQHPGIVQVFEVGEHQGHSFLSLEFCPGGSLERRLQRTPLPPGEAAALVAKLARAVQAAHEAKVIHRDLKPANVLLAADGSPKITDFGLAKKLDESGQTLEGSAVGTPSYMPPEQAQGKKDVGPLADVYSLGAVLYECLTGRPPFKAATVYDTLVQVVLQEPVPPSQLNALVSADLETIALKCLQKEPSRRYASAAALADDLRRWLNGEPVQARPVGPASRLWRWARRNPRVALLSGAVALLLIALSLGSAVAALAIEGERQAALGQKSVAERLAEEKTLLAETQTRLARENANLASRERDARGAAEGQTRLAGERLDHARRSLLGSQIAFASSRWAQDPTAARRALDDPARCPENLREFTWRFFHRLCRRDHVRLAAHKGRVTFVAFLPDGRLVTAGHDGRVTLQDPAEGKAVLVLDAHRAPITAGAVSRDGRRLATADRTGAVKLWDLPSGRERAALRGLTGLVFDLAFSPDGRLVAAGGLDTLMLWSAIRGGPQNRIRGPEGAFWSLAFRPDGKMLVAGGKARGDTPESFRAKEKLELMGGLRLYTGKDFGEVVVSPDYSLGRFAALAFLPDGAALLSLTEIGGVVRIDLDTFRCSSLAAWPGETGVALAVAPDGATVATASRPGYVYAPGHSPRSAPSDGDREKDAGKRGPRVTLSLQSSAARYRTVRLWDAGAAEPRTYLPGAEGKVRCLAFSPGGKVLATGDERGDVTLWDATGRPERATFSARKEHVYRLRVSEGGRTLLLGGKTRAFLLDTATGRSRLPAGEKFEGPLAVSPDARRLVARRVGESAAGPLDVWDMAAARPLHPLPGSAGVVAPLFSPNSQTVAGAGKRVRVWGAGGGREPLDLEQSEGATPVAFSPDGKRLACSSARPDGPIRLWELATGKVRATLEGSAGTSAPVFSPDGTMLAAASGAGRRRVKVWDAGSGKVLAVLAGHAGAPSKVVFSPDGATVITVANERSKGVELRQWESRTGRVVAAWRDSMPELLDLAVSPDGRVVALGGGFTGGGDPENPRWATRAEKAALGDHFGPQYGEVVLWDVPGRRERARLKGHRSTVWSLAFSPDGRTLATGSYDYTARLWETATGVELAVLQGHQSTVLSVAFAPDGEALATGGYDQVVKWWAAPRPERTLPPWALRGGEPPPERPRASEDRRWSRQFAEQAAFRGRLEQLRLAAEEQPANVELLGELAEGYHRLALLQHSQGQTEAAAGTLSRSLAFRRKLADARPDREAYRAKLAECYLNLGDLQRSIKEHAAALENGRQALELQQKLLDARPDDLRRRSLVGASHNNLGMALIDLGKPRESLDHFEKAIAHQRAAHEKAPGVRRYRIFLRNHYANLSRARRKLRQPAEAVKAALVARDLSPEDPYNLYAVAQDLARCVPLVGRNPDALSPEEKEERKKYTDMAVRTLREAFSAGFDHPDALEKDLALKPIHDDPAFRALLRQKVPSGEEK
jgi:WD40 repeat protein